jgi:hypothetical protein
MAMLQQGRKTLCRKLSRAEIKGVSVTSSDLSEVSRAAQVLLRTVTHLLRFLSGRRWEAQVCPDYFRFATLRGLSRGGSKRKCHGATLGNSRRNHP